MTTPSIWVATPLAALTATVKNKFINILTPCVINTPEPAPKKFHPAKSTIWRMKDLSIIILPLHSSNCLLQYMP